MVFMKRIFIYFFLIFLSGLSIPCSADEAQDCGLIIKVEKGDNGKKLIKSVFSIKADPEHVYQTLKNVKMFSEFMPGAADVEILEKGSNYQVVKFSGSRGLFSADIVMRRTINDSDKRIDWRLIDGPPKEICGFWHVERDKQRESMAIVQYTNYVDAGALIPEFLVRKYLREDIKRMVPNIIKRVESLGTWLSDDYLKKISQKDK